MISTSNIIQFLPSTKSDPYRCQNAMPTEIHIPPNKSSSLPTRRRRRRPPVRTTPFTQHPPTSSSSSSSTWTHRRRHLPSTTTCLPRRRLLLQKINPQLRHTLQSAPTIRGWGLGTSFPVLGDAGISCRMGLELLLRKFAEVVCRASPAFCRCSSFHSRRLEIKFSIS